MKQFLFRYQYQILIVVIGLLWLLGLNALLQLNVQRFVFPDSQDYALAAHELFIKHSPHCYRALVMAFFTGLPYIFGGADAVIYQWSFVINLLCWLGTALLLFEISRSFLQEKYAFVWAVGFFLLIGNAVLTCHLLTETLYTFWLICSFYFLFRYYKSNEFRFLSMAIGLLLLSMLIKPGSKFLAVVFVLYFIRDILRNYKLKSAFFIWLSLLLIAIQLISMKAKFGDYKISYIDGVTYYNYLFAKAEAYKTNADYIEIKTNRANFILSQSIPKQKDIAFTDLKNQLRHNADNVFKAYLSNLIANTKTGSDAILKLENNAKNSVFDYSKALFFSVSKWQNRLFTLLGIALALVFLLKRKTHNLPFSLMGFFVLYTIFLSGISSDQGDRFHLVAFPAVLLLMAKWLSDLRSQTKI